MNRNQIENLYKINDLSDYKLKTTEDLLKVHGIDYKAIDGYKRLDEINKKLYEKFIVNIFNAFGLESRDTLIPKGIYFVEDVDYLAKENVEDDYFMMVGGVVYSIDKNGIKSVLHTWKDEDYLHLETTVSESKRYLRFEYEHQRRSEWLHVTNENMVLRS